MLTKNDYGCSVPFSASMHTQGIIHGLLLSFALAPIAFNNIRIITYSQ